MGLKRFIADRCIASDHTAVPLATDDVYRLLAEHRRRLVLSHLADLDAEEVTVAELARAVAAAETGAAPFDVAPDDYEAAYVALYQSHLPVLDSAGVVSWDRDAGTVRPGRSLLGLAGLIEEIDRRTQE